MSLSFTGEDPRLSIPAGRSRFNLPVLPAGDFPVMSSRRPVRPRSTIDAADLIRLIDKTRFAISTEETRYYLNGLYLHTVVEGGAAKLRAVATDGHRLALAEMPAPEGAAGLPGVIVPAQDHAGGPPPAGGRRRAGRPADQPPEGAASSSAGAALTSKVIDGSFPDYVRVIPQGQQQDPDGRQRAVRPGRGPGGHHLGGEVAARCRWPSSPAKIVLTVRNMEAGQAVEELEVDYDGEPFEIGFNARYLLDVTDQIQRRDRRVPLRRPGQPGPGARPERRRASSTS